MLINLAFIKAPNGLFYYALDYIAALLDDRTVVLVRTSELATSIENRFPGINVRVVKPMSAACRVWRASSRGEMVFTPSSHPIPLCRHQMVVVHDTFPFEGSVGAVKAALFFLAMRSSGASAGYINISDARDFLQKGGLNSDRLVASPNHMAPPLATLSSGALRISEQPAIGLFGTDSPKKNYLQLFDAIAQCPSNTRAQYRIFGQPNAYVSQIMQRFPNFDIQLTDSSKVTLEEFIRSLDMVASAATREGFSRPMALALALGKPCLIVDAPVFREFYGASAIFHPGVEALGEALAGLVPGEMMPRPDFALPDQIERDFRACIEWLKARDTYRR